VVAKRLPFTQLRNDGDDGLRRIWKNNRHSESTSEWQIFLLDESTGKRSRVTDVVIPDFVGEDEITGWLDDIYHESASITRPCVVRLK